ncbi:ABC transporter family substrate-binding protein [Phytomonospora sp. NPDC050363]|uniref:ABC transporter family substrate-binding protein n=1 Tax=Phytomonospora sp. NPDC050363 TaxID=3155642 RepID=UPI0033CB0409
MLLNRKRPLPRRPLTGVLAAVALLVLASCAGSEDDSGTGQGLQDCAADVNSCNSGERADGGEIVWAISNGWEEWNNTTSSGNSVYLNQVLHGVFPLTGRFEPDATWKWSRDLLAAEPVLVSEEPQAWQYEIRPEAVWDDGTPIGLDDFTWYWYALSGDDALCAECTPAATTYGGQVASITETEKGTVTITLKPGEKNPEWRSAAALSYPAHVAAGAGFDWKNDPAQMAASMEYFSETVPAWSGGPYRIDTAVVGEQVVKVPNDKWYGEIEPTLDKLIVKVVSDTRSLLPGIENGELDGAAPAALDADVAEQAGAVEGLHSALSGGPSWEHVDVNVHNKWLADVRLRTAIFTAIDVADVNARTYGQVTDKVERRLNHLFKASSPYFEDKITATGQGSGDVEKAKEILTAAGYTLADGKLTKDGQTVGPFRFRTLDGHPMRQITAELVQSYLAELGIEIVLDPIAADKLGSALSERDFDMVLFGWSGTPEFSTAPKQFWGSASASNFGGNDNASIDDVIATIRQTVDPAEAAARTNEAIAKVVADAYILPLVTTPAMVLVSDDYVNIRDTAASPLRSVYNHEEWGLAAQ